MPNQTKLREKEKRRRGRPAKNKIEPIEASPEEIGQALAKAAERKAEQRRLQEVNS